MRVGIDTFSYHRLLGWGRPGEEPTSRRLPDGDITLISEARLLHCDIVSLETCFLPEPAAVDSAALLAAAGDDIELALAWGHPTGLAFGTDPDAPADLFAWLDVAAALRSRMIRITVGGPALRHTEPIETQFARTIPLLHAVTARAAELGLDVAIENHGDLSAAELTELVDRTGAPNLGICFDTANAARVGDDVLEAARTVAPHVLMVHLKDIEHPDTAASPITGPFSVPYGEGVIPLRAVLDALAEPIAHGAPVCVEIGHLRPGDDEFEQVVAGVRWLRDQA